MAVFLGVYQDAMVGEEKSRGVDDPDGLGVQESGLGRAYYQRSVAEHC